MLIREHYEDRETWLAHRTAIGGSEAAAAIGISPFMTNVELWEIKTGRKAAKDLSGNKAVENGIRMEGALRAMYAAEHPEMEVTHCPFDILKQDATPFLGCTLDAELRERETGRKGVLEIKEVLATSRLVWMKWKDQVPPYYFVQVMAQLIATGWDFVDLYAQLKRLDGDSELRNYRFEREMYAEDMEWLKGKLGHFWTENIVKDIRPAIILPEL